MARELKKRPVFASVILIVVGAVALGALLLHRSGLDRPGPFRTVVLSMRDYTFNGTNPTFTFREGDRVRFVVRNDETTPIRHNFAIPSLHVPCDKELGPGEIRHVLITLSRPGTYEYLCCTHRGMGGRIVVEPR
jgi:plastocyanin